MISLKKSLISLVGVFALLTLPVAHAGPGDEDKIPSLKILAARKIRAELGMKYLDIPEEKIQGIFFEPTVYSEEESAKFESYIKSIAETPEILTALFSDTFYIGFPQAPLPLLTEWLVSVVPDITFLHNKWRDWGKENKGAEISSLCSLIKKAKNAKKISIVMESLFFDLHGFTTQDLKGIIDSLNLCSNLRNINLSLYSMLSLPDNFSDLTNIRNLNLRYNGLEDLRVVEHLTNLQTLNLSYNSSLKDLRFLKGLKNLQELNLEWSHLTDLPQEFSHLMNLRILNLGFNKPKDISNIKHMPKLEDLSLRGCGVKILPQEIKTLKNLRYLDLRGNKIENPEVLGELTNLEDLNLKGCWLTSLPQEIQNLLKLRRLNLYSNSLQNIESIKYLINLENLSLLKPVDVSKNIQALTNLQRLKLGSLNPNERIDFLTYLTNIQKLSINFRWSKKLAKEPTKFPKELQRLPKLRILNLRWSYFHTDISLEGLGTLVNLEHLRLYEHISLPEEICHIKNLKVLNLSGSKLEGIHNLQFLTTLEDLNMRGCYLKKIPEEVLKMKNLRKFDISNNPLESMRNTNNSENAEPLHQMLSSRDSDILTILKAQGTHIVQ